MADSFSASVDARRVIAMLERVGPSVEFHVRDIAREAAIAVVTRAKQNVNKRTRETEGRIHWEKTFDGQGYVAMAYSRESRIERAITRRRTPNANYGQRHREAHVDRYLERGTQFMTKRPFFFSAGQAEAAVFVRRVETKLQTVLDDLGR